MDTALKEYNMTGYIKGMGYYLGLGLTFESCGSAGFHVLTFVMLNKKLHPLLSFQPIRLLDPGFFIQIHIFY